MKDLVEYTIKNLNRDKLFKQIINICDIKNIKILDDKLKFCVDAKYIKKVDLILQNNQVNILQKKSIGLKGYLKRSVLKIGVLISLLIFSVFVFVCNLFVFKYEVIGNEFIKTNEILKVLQDKNICGITPKGNIDLQSLEHSIEKLNNISFVSAIIKGNTLVINIKESIYNSEYEEKDNFKPIISEQNGIITEISVIQGTPLVKTGDSVKKGQELVAPFVVDSLGNKIGVLPMADIKADVYYTTVSEIPDTFISQQDTGNFVKAKSISLFNIDIFNNINKCNFLQFRTEEKINCLSKNILPIYLKEIVFYEQDTVIIQDYFSTNQEKILLDCKQKTRQLVKEYDIIKQEHYHIVSNAGLNRITYTCVVNKSIC